MQERILPCVPPLWAKGGHAQTIFAHLLPSKGVATEGKYIDVTLPDGDRLRAEFFQGTSDLLIYVFHGLGGDTSAAYMRRTALLAQKRGHSVVLVNHRGCGRGKGLSRGIYHSGRAEDLSEVIKWGRKEFPRHRHLAIGFSLSAHALLLLLTGTRGEVLPDFAISVNGPINLTKASRALSEGLNRIYDLKFVWECTREVKYREKMGFIEKDKIHIPRFSSIFEFDEIYTANAAGYTNRKEFYSAVAAAPHLDKIKTPTVILTSKDDPFVDYREYLKVSLSKSTHLHIENVGGHMGYLSREMTPLGSQRWLDYALDYFVRGLVNREITSSG